MESSSQNCGEFFLNYPLKTFLSYIKKTEICLHLNERYHA